MRVLKDQRKIYKGRVLIKRSWDHLDRTPDRWNDGMVRYVFKSKFYFHVLLLR